MTGPTFCLHLFSSNLFVFPLKKRVFFSVPPFNCYLLAGKWKEFNWDQPGSCQQLELKSFHGGDVRAEPGGLFSTSRQSLHHVQPGWVGLILLLFDWDVDKGPWELQWEVHRPRPEDFFLLLMRNRRCLERNLAMRKTFLSLPAWKKSILSHPSLSAEARRVPHVAQVGFDGEATQSGW